MIRKNIVFIAFVGTLIQLQGCATPVEGARQADYMGGVITEKNAVYIVDDALHSVKKTLLGKEKVKGKISIDGKGLRRTPTGMNEVWVSVRNRTDVPLMIESRVTWHYASGAPVDGPSTWQKTALPANSISTITQASIHQDAATFNMEIREVR